MEDLRPGTDAPEPDETAVDLDVDAVARAEEVFASLTAQVDAGDGGAGRAPERGPRAGPAARPPAAVETPGLPAPRAPRAADEPGAGEVAAAALAATDRIAEVVDLLAAQSEATTADFASLGRAVEAALEATNERLTSLERIVQSQAGVAGSASADPVERAMDRLRRSLRRPTGGPGDQGGARPHGH